MHLQRNPREQFLLLDVLLYVTCASVPFPRTHPVGRYVAKSGSFDHVSFECFVVHYSVTNEEKDLQHTTTNLKGV